MLVAGICRFSLVGRGDWKAYQGKTDEEVEAIAADQAAMLFTTERMNKRLATFEHLTLASLKAQTDPDFMFIVLASKLMPKRFRERLEKICSEVPQVQLRFFGLTSAGEAQKKVFKEYALKFSEVLQFRLDDDDCLCVDYIASMKSHTKHLMERDEEPFSATIHGVMYTKVNGPDTVIYNWPVDFFSAGAAVRHQSKSVYDFGHFALGHRFESVSISGRLSLVTNNGTNDTEFDAEMIRKRRMSVMTQEQVNIAIDRNFAFLNDQGRKLSGISDFLMKSAARSSPWMSDLVFKGGMFISDDDIVVRYIPRDTDILVVSTSYSMGNFEHARLADGPFSENCRRLNVSSLDIVLRRDSTNGYSAVREIIKNFHDRGIFASFENTLVCGIAEGVHLSMQVAREISNIKVLAFSPKVAHDDIKPRPHDKIDLCIVADPKHFDTGLFAGIKGERVQILRARHSGQYTKRFLDHQGLLDELILSTAIGQISSQNFYKSYRSARSNRNYQADFVNDLIMNNSLSRLQVAYQYFKKNERSGLALEIHQHLNHIGMASGDIAGGKFV